MDAQRRRLIADGLAAGLIGYAVVVVFFVVLNVTMGRSPLYTAALMGEALFDGLRDPAAVTLAPGPILAFNGIHIAAYLLFGFFAAWLVYETELHPQFWYLTFFLFLGATVLGYAAILAVMALIGNPVPTWATVGASVLAALAMAAYLTASHRSLVEAISREQETGEGGAEY